VFPMDPFAISTSLRLTPLVHATERPRSGSALRSEIFRASGEDFVHKGLVPSARASATYRTRQRSICQWSSRPFRRKHRVHLLRLSLVLATTVGTVPGSRLQMLPARQITKRCIASFAKTIAG
jgi:hypothetical protein